MATDPLVLRVAHALGAEADRHAYTHYRPEKTEQELRCILIDGDVDLMRLAETAIRLVRQQLQRPQPLAANSVPPQAPTTDRPVKPPEKPRR